MDRRITRVAIAGLLVLALVAGLLLLVKPGAVSPAQRLPDPNGYADIVKAGGLISTKLPELTPSLTTEECRTYVSTNQEALRLVRVGLNRECCVPVQYSLQFIESHMNELGRIKALAQAMRIEGKLAERENRPADAARDYLDMIRLGNEISRGGLLIDALVGVACEAMGNSALRTVGSLLEAPQCRELIRALEQIESKREALSEVFQRERQFGRRAGGWKGVLTELVTAGQTKLVREKTEQKLLTQVSALREIEIILAVRAFEQEKGHPPETLTELVPDYLKSVPKDPNTGAPLVYRP